ncbi:MAG: [FeFe] hydrogenase H-cluster radical SAM maturase HydE [Oligoflexia bacterium]|nr:[FeFe] hydrogenase H-cluster radical SAM maturase HydE [Oligoflexia bacterium]
MIKKEITELLKLRDVDQGQLFKDADFVREKYVGREVYLRALIEYSNICRKDCYYCGIRSSNKCQSIRYTLNEEEVLEVAVVAQKQKINSLVIQSGERCSNEFVDDIERLLKVIAQKFNNQFRVTLSCGEQSKDVYKRWYDAGGVRYLLRFETSNQSLYKKIHPSDSKHDFRTRLQCLNDLKELGFQVGSGFMMGLPTQNYDDIASDLLFLKELDVDMVGMGPYLPHNKTPLFASEEWDLNEKINVSLNAIATLRIMMKDINIAATTALRAAAIDGRSKGIRAGANVVMPNFTPKKYREEYYLYENKPLVYTDEQMTLMEEECVSGQYILKYGEWGDSKHSKHSKQNRIFL